MLAKLEKTAAGEALLPLSKPILDHIKVPGTDLSELTFCGRYLSDGILVTTIPRGDPVPKGCFEIEVTASPGE